MDRNYIASKLVKAAKKLTAGEVKIASQIASYSWEYTSIQISAVITLNTSTGNLRLEMNKHSSNSGINSYDRHTKLEDVRLGHISKPNLRLAQSLLKKHNFERSRASVGFGRQWRDANGGRNTLGNIIAEWRAEMKEGRSDKEKLQDIIDQLDSVSSRQLDLILNVLEG